MNIEEELPQESSGSEEEDVDIKSNPEPDTAPSSQPMDQATN